jgi:general secretion pathway protein A
MYTDWFRLQELPFRLRPDAEFLHPGGGAKAALTGLRAGIRRGAAVVTLCGPSGTGKTTLLQLLANEAVGGHALARLALPELTAAELMTSLQTQFGLADVQPAVAGSAPLARFIAEETGRGRPPLVLVDRAHEFSDPSLNELLRLCMRPPTPRLVLAGENTLLQRIAASPFKVLPAATDTDFELRCFDARDTCAYVQHRLDKAGAAGRELFEPDSLREIQRYTGGTARLINALCDRAMSIAESHNSATVTANDVRDAVKALNWVEFQPAAAAIVPVASTLALQITLNGELVTYLRLLPGRLTVGRGEEVDVQLHSKSVSRQHCQIVTTEGRSYIEDLKSTNGVVVNGKRVRVHRLRPDDVVQIGELRLTCQVAASATP